MPWVKVWLGDKIGICEPRQFRFVKVDKVEFKFEEVEFKLKEGTVDEIGLLFKFNMDKEWLFRLGGREGTLEIGNV